MCNKITDKKVARIGEIGTLKILIVEAGPWYENPEDEEPDQLTEAGMKSIGRLKGLTELVIWGGSHSDEGLYRLHGFKNLEVLLLLPGAHDVTRAGLKSLAGFSRLRRLCLVGAGIGDEDLKYLCPLKHLSDLDLTNTRVAGAGIAILSELPALKSLDLSNTGIDDLDIDALSKLNALEFLGVERTKICAEGLQRLRESMPAATIKPKRI